MKNNEPEVQAILVTCIDRDGETILSRGVRLIENHDPSCENKDWNYDPLVRLSDYEALQAECEKLRRDAERIEWLEDQTKKSRTGISFDYHRYAEDGYVVDHGYRFMRRHFVSGFKDSLRKAIDAAMEGDKP